MKIAAIWVAVLFVLSVGTASPFGQTISDEARRHFDRGVAAMEMAQSPKDCAVAIDEFEQAARLAPDWPDVFYNLGLAQEGAEKYADSARSYRKYLELSPNAADAEEVRSLINRLEFKAERERTLTTEDVAEVLASIGDKDIWDDIDSDFDSVLFGAISRVGDSRIKIPRMLVSRSDAPRGYEVVEQEGYQTINVGGPVISFSLEGSWVGYPIPPGFLTVTDFFEITVLSKASVKVSKYSLLPAAGGTVKRSDTIVYRILRRS